MLVARSVSFTLCLAVIAGCSGDPTTAPRARQVARTDVSAAAIVVTNTNDNGPGSLRDAVFNAAGQATIEFAPEIAGQTITLTTASLQISKSLTIAGPSAGMTISGGGALRVLLVSGIGTEVVLRNLTITGGRATSGAGISNASKLTLDHVLVTGNVSNSGASISFPGNGGGISTGPDSHLTLINSTVSGNSADGSGGGVFARDDVTIINSTIVGNTAAQGGGLWLWDEATTELRNVLIANNTSADGPNCWIRANTIVSYLGTSMFGDASCGTGAGTIVADPIVGALASNGGPTKTHALLQGSPAIEAATDCTVANDQRYVTRPQGPACDIGAFEFTDYVTVALTIDASMSVGPSNGIAVVSGSIKCSAPGPVELEVKLSQPQKVGRVSTVIEASDLTTVDCDGTRYWSVSLKPASGGFQNGVATADVKTGKIDPWVAPTATSSAVKLFWGRK